MQSFILDFFTTNILHCSKKVKNRHRKMEFFFGKKGAYVAFLELP